MKIESTITWYGIEFDYIASIDEDGEAELNKIKVSGLDDNLDIEDCHPDLIEACENDAESEAEDSGELPRRSEWSALGLSQRNFL